MIRERIMRRGVITQRADAFSLNHWGKEEGVKLVKEGWGTGEEVSPEGERGEEQELVLRLLDEAYKKKTWHGPNLRKRSAE